VGEERLALAGADVVEFGKSGLQGGGGGLQGGGVKLGLGGEGDQVGGGLLEGGALCAELQALFACGGPLGQHLDLGLGGGGHLACGLLFEEDPRAQIGADTHGDQGDDDQREKDQSEAPPQATAKTAHFGLRTCDRAEHATPPPKLARQPEPCGSAPGSGPGRAVCQ